MEKPSCALNGKYAWMHSAPLNSNLFIPCSPRSLLPMKWETITHFSMIMNHAFDSPNGVLVAISIILRAVFL